MSMYSYVPVLPAYAASIGADVVMIGLLGGVYGVLQIVLRIPLGIVRDRIGKDRTLLIVGFSILCISNLMFVFLGNSIEWLITARAMAGAAAAWWVVVCAAYSHYHNNNQQVKAQGTLSASANGGKVVASLLCAVVAMLAGYYATFSIGLVASAIGLLLMFGIKEKDVEKRTPVKLKDQLLLFKNKELMILCFFSILSQLLCFGVPTTFTQVIAKDMGADSFDLGMLMLSFFLATSVSSLFVGTKAYKKLGGINAVAISFLIGAFSCIPLFYQSNLVSIYIMQILSGVCYGIGQAALTGFVMLSVPQTQRGVATGIYQSLFGIGILLGPVLMGFVIDFSSFAAAYWMMVGIMTATAALCYVLLPRKYNKVT